MLVFSTQTVMLVGWYFFIAARAYHDILDMCEQRHSCRLGRPHSLNLVKRRLIHAQPNLSDQFTCGASCRDSGLFTRSIHSLMNEYSLTGDVVKGDDPSQASCHSPHAPSVGPLADTIAANFSPYRPPAHNAVLAIPVPERSCVHAGVHAGACIRNPTY